MNAAELTKERAELLARVEQINAALELLGGPAKPVEIWTRRNLRNTPVCYRVGTGDSFEWKYIKVYSDASMTKEAGESGHGGFVTAQDAAAMTNSGQFDDDLLGLV